MNHALELVLLLSFFAGAVQALTPDHWLPASLLAWQRGWGMTRSVLLASFALTLHLGMGLLAYFAFDFVFGGLSSRTVFGLSVLFVFGLAFVRMFRFQKVQQVFHAGPYRGKWAVLVILSILGPAEPLVPILIKAGHLGIGYFSATMAFAAGTLLIGTLCVLFGRYLWNRPLWLPRGFSLAHHRASLIPVALGLVVGITVILKI